MNIVLILGCAITMVKSEALIIIGRLIYGIAIGASSAIVPGFSKLLIYLNSYLVNEVAPTEIKGPMGALNSSLINTGVFLAFVMAVPLPNIAANPALYYNSD